MRFNKVVRVRRMHYGLYWEAYGLMEKVITLSRQVDDEPVEGDVVGKIVGGARRLATTFFKKFIEVADGVRMIVLDVDGRELIDSAEGWRKVEFRTVPLRSVIGDEGVRWKGEWGLIRTSLKYTTEPKRRVH